MTEKQSIDSPHERRAFKEHGHMDVVTLGDVTLPGMTPGRWARSPACCWTPG